MKKFVAVALAGVSACALCFGLAACKEDETNEEAAVAYGLVHGGSYVGKATVEVDKDGKVTDATLNEVCLPTYVTADDSVAAEDKVTVTVTDHGSEVEKSYYKTVSYGDVTLTYDATAKDYKSGSTTMAEFFQTEANAKAFFEAVMENKVSVSVGGENKTDIMNKASLCKEENGYWTTKDDEDNSYSRWKVNRDATVEYVKENGVQMLATLVRNTEGTTDDYGANAKYWVDGNGVSTGATWTDMNSDTSEANYFSYAQLFVKAYIASDSELVLRGEYSYANTHAENSFYGQKVDVTFKDGKVTKVTLVSSDWIEVSDPVANTPWTEDSVANWNDNKAEYLARFEGKTVAEINAMTVECKDSGEPSAVTGIEVVTDATQSSGRVLLAVQDALALIK